MPCRRCGPAALRVLLLFLVGACGSVPSAATATRLPTAVPAPTVSGQSVEAFAPDSDETVAVVGVADGSALPVHVLPGLQNPVVGEVPNTADDVFGLGEAFETPDGNLWWLVRWETLQGWAQPGLAYLGPTVDITSEVAPSGTTRVAPSVDELALTIASSLAFGAPEARVVLVRSADISDDLSGTAIVDVVGLPDDSVGGLRLAVTGSGAASSGTEFTLTAVDRTSLCSRGVTEAGLCV